MFWPTEKLPRLSPEDVLHLIEMDVNPFDCSVGQGFPESCWTVMPADILDTLSLQVLPPTFSPDDIVRLGEKPRVLDRISRCGRWPKMDVENLIALSEQCGAYSMPPDCYPDEPLTREQVVRLRSRILQRLSRRLWPVLDVESILRPEYHGQIALPYHAWPVRLTDDEERRLGGQGCLAMLAG
jgi:hypothetical protein